MRDLIFSLILLGTVVGIGCGVALAQYRAESPNYSLEYLDEGGQPSGGVQGVEFEARAQQAQGTVTATELPATNPPLAIAAVFIALLIAVIAYFAIKK